MAKITNTTKAILGVNAKVDGKVRSVSLTPGETRDLDVIETPVHKARIKSGALVSGASAAKKAQDSSAGYAVAEKGAGWFAITQDGQEVTKSLRKDDVAGFDALSDADKAKFVEANKAD